MPSVSHSYANRKTVQLMESSHSVCTVALTTALKLWNRVSTREHCASDDTK